MWNPWMGSDSRYEERRLLIVGESCYDYWEGDELLSPAPDHPTVLVEHIKSNFRQGSNFMKKLTRALCGCESPSPEQVSDAWSSVALTNYYPITVGEGPTGLKTSEGWKQAAQEWPMILERTKPKNVIILGLGMWKDCFPIADEVRSERRHGYRLSTGDIAMCHATMHPSRGPSWSEYVKFIAEAERACHRGSEEMDRGSSR